MGRPGYNDVHVAVLRRQDSDKQGVVDEREDARKENANANGNEKGERD